MTLSKGMFVMVRRVEGVAVAPEAAAVESVEISSLLDETDFLDELPRDPSESAGLWPRRLSGEDE